MFENIHSTDSTEYDFFFLSRFRNFPSRISVWLVAVFALSPWFANVFAWECFAFSWNFNFYVRMEHLNAVEWWTRCGSFFLASSAHGAALDDLHSSLCSVVECICRKRNVSNRYICTFDRPSENNNSFASSSHRSHSHVPPFWISVPTSPSMLAPRQLRRLPATQHQNRCKLLHSFAIHGQFTHELVVDLANITDFAENAAVDLSDTKILFMFAPDGAERANARKGRVEWDVLLLFVAARTCEHKMPSKQRSKLSSIAVCWTSRPKMTLFSLLSLFSSIRLCKPVPLRLKNWVIFAWTKLYSFCFIWFKWFDERADDIYIQDCI